MKQSYETEVCCQMCGCVSAVKSIPSFKYMENVVITVDVMTELVI